MSDEAFGDFLKRVRAGDPLAASELVHRYESVIRREIRFRLTDPSVYRTQDDEDICQSVLASFFIRVSLGQFDLNDPVQLQQLLLCMARNKLSNAVQRQHRQKRGGAKNLPESAEDMSLAGPGATPSRIVAGRELLEKVREGLTDEERQVAELRGQGHAWPEIARQIGGTPDGRRKQLTRALDRISRGLGLEEYDG
jgi:RNA polymerase sigma factor (sigma-70 family)